VTSLEKRAPKGRLRWYARYRDPTGKQLVRVFDRTVDGGRFLTTVEAPKLTGTYVDAKRAAIRFRAFAEERWEASSPNLAADTTRGLKRSRVDRHVLPVLGDYPLGAVGPSTIPAAVGTWPQTLAPGTVGQILRQVCQILDAACTRGAADEENRG
jgi:hypothetical protein